MSDLRSRLALVVCTLALMVLASACHLAGASEAVPSSTSSPRPSATVVPASPTPDERIWGLVLLPEGERLPLRAAPADEAEIVAELLPSTTGLRLGGEERSWRQVRTPDGLSGWIPAHYLTEIVPAAQFCSDERVDDLLRRFSAAVQQRDGDALQTLVSPTHGMIVRISWWNPAIQFLPQEVAGLFSEERVYDWGVEDGSGLPVQGSFAQVILPMLDDVLGGEFDRYCNDLEKGSGPSAGLKIWPSEYAGINFYALYRPAPADMEFDWATWAVGIEYVNGRPFIAFLVHYAWEI